MATITEQKWNQLNNEQKNNFREEVGKKFDNGNLPSDENILNFLGNKGIETGIIELGEEEVPPGQDDVWEKVLNYFSK